MTNPSPSGPLTALPETNTSAQQDISLADKAASIADTGKQSAGELARTAADGTAAVVQETKQQAGDLLGRTKSQLLDQAVTQKQSVVASLRDLGAQLAAMTDDVDAHGTAIDLAATTREHAGRAADWLDSREPSDILEEIRTFGRSHPGRLLLSAGLAGLTAGRLTRGAVATHTESAEPGSNPVAPPATVDLDAPSAGVVDPSAQWTLQLPETAG